MANGFDLVGLLDYWLNWVADPFGTLVSNVDRSSLTDPALIKRFDQAEADFREHTRTLIDVTRDLTPDWDADQLADAEEAALAWHFGERSPLHRGRLVASVREAISRVESLRRDLGRSAPPALKPLASYGPVELFGPKLPPKVGGMLVDLLTRAEYKAVLALVDSREKGISMKNLKAAAGPGAVNTLRSLTHKSEVWKKVIRFPGRKKEGGSGYCIWSDAQPMHNHALNSNHEEQ